MGRLVPAICDCALAPNGVAPEWVHLLPQGGFTGRDGRTFEVANASALVLDFQSRGIDLPIDYEHQNDKPEAKLSGPVPAAGWIKELKIAEGGIWGRVEWTETAVELIGRKEYRFLSPSLLIDPKTRQVHRLKGAGLVHNPNLFLTALASQEDTMKPTLPVPPAPPSADLAAQLATLLGLPATSTAEDLVKALAALLAKPVDPAKFVPVETLQELLVERRTELNVQRQSRIASKVKHAVEGHYITNGMRDWALSLCESNEAAFDEFCEKAGPTFAYLFKPQSKFTGSYEAHEVQPSALESAICEQLGLKPGSLID